MFSAWDKLPISHKRKPKAKLVHSPTLVDWVTDILMQHMPVTDRDRDKGTITVCSTSNDSIVHVLQFTRIK